MTPYLAVLTFVAGAAVLSKVSSPRYRWLYAVPPTFLLLLFMGFRERISADWDQYYNFFQVYAKEPFLMARADVPTEIGYGILNAAIGQTTGNFHLLLITCAALLLWGVLEFARTFELDPSLTLFMACPYLLFVVGMGYERQSAAIGLSMVALAQLQKKRLRSFFLVAFVASTLHYSAGPFLLVFWVDSWRKGVFAALIGGCSIFLSQIGDAVEKLNGYVSGDLTASGVYFRLGILAVALTFAFVQRKCWRAHRGLYSYVKRSAGILAVMAVFASSQSVIVDRFALYFFFVYLLCLGKAIDFSEPARRWLTFGLLGAQAYGILIVWFSVSMFARYFWTPYTISFY